MNPHAYTEDQSAIGLFVALGRETRGEVVLVDRLRAVLGTFNWS